jgi:chaperone BCS1
MKMQLKSLIDGFIAHENFYHQNGIPYKKGMIFYGPPGCGKTSTIYAITHYLSRNLYFIRLNELNSGDKLKTAVSKIPENAIVVIEDIDRYKVTHKDTDSTTTEPSKVDSKHDSSSSEGEEETKPSEKDTATTIVFTSKKSKSKENGILATLLEVLDGYNYLHGAIIILTTNHIEKLDPALIRPGRMDHKFFFGYLIEQQIRDIMGHFYSGITKPKDEKLQLDPTEGVGRLGFSPLGCFATKGKLQLENLLKIQDLTSAELINNMIIPDVLS